MQKTIPARASRQFVRTFGAGVLTTLCLSHTAFAGDQPAENASAARRAPYPPARRSDQVDTYHGVTVADPYRWLEDTDSAETRAWIEAQNRLTGDFLTALPQRARIRERLAELWDYEKFGIPVKRGGRYFFTRQDGLANQPSLYMLRSLDGEPVLVLDPNALSADGTVALTGYEVSENGLFLAYGLATAGSDWQEWKVRETDTLGDLPDHLRWVKFSGVSWTHDNLGFFYSRYDEPDEATRLTGTNYYQKLYYHRIGTPQSEDELRYERKDQKEWGFDGRVTDDGRYLVIRIWRGTEEKNAVFYQDLVKRDAPIVELLNEFDAEYAFVGNDAEVFWFRSDLDAPRGRLIAIDTRLPERAAWRELIPQAAESLQSVGLVGERFAATYLKDAHSQVRFFDLSGKFTGELALDQLGSVSGFDGRRGDDETFYSFTSFTTPATIYRYDAGASRSTFFRHPRLPFNPDEFETNQVFYSSRDGTRVPMFLVYRKGLKRDGANATYLFGYGGFNIAITPAFSPSNMLWLELGGLWAVANLRGGGEYGREWHEAGMKLNKQNVFDDFVAAAEWLIRERYTSRERLAIGGRSNGGLLVGACLTQRPDLFAAALPAVGVMDMLRFDRFTIGWAWVSDYGSSADAAEFRALLAYSPLHNIKHGTSYPATWITTADHDDRVVPGHSFKFGAALQAAQAGAAPVLMRIDTRAGHGSGKPTTKLIEEAADMWTFLTEVLNVPVRPTGEQSRSVGQQN